MKTIEIGEYLAPLRRWWWLLVLSTLLAGISSAVYTKQQPLLYRASATLMVGTALMNPNPNGGEISLAGQLAMAYADIGMRTGIRAATQQELGLEWLPEYSVYAIPNTQLIEIAVTDTSPERAQAVAAELANQLVQQTPGGNPQQSRQTFLEGQIVELEASILETNEEIARLEQELTGLFSARQIADTRAQIAALELKVSTLQANYANLLANSRQSSTNIITLIEPAELPMAPLGSDLIVNTAVAAMAGFALAAAGAYIMEYLDQSLRSTQEATRHLNLLILGAIPRLSHRELKKHGPLVSDGPHTPVMDAYAALRLNVQTALDDSPGRVLLVTSPSPEEGKSTIAANLAIDWAHSGQKVILVDADLYHPSQQRLFDLPNQSGLTTALVESEMALNSLIKPSKIRGLWVLTSGPLLPNPTPLLAQQAMTKLLATLRSKADVIIVDTPPATAVVDASILALQADGVLLALSVGRTRRELAKRTLDLFQQIHAQVLGVALFNSPLQHTFYRYYGNNYGGRVKWPETIHGRDAHTDVEDATWEYVKDQDDAGFHPD